MNKQYKLILDDYDFNMALKSLENYEHVAYDTETTGLNTRKCTIIGMAFSGEEGSGFYLPLYYWDNELKNAIENPRDKAMTLLAQIIIFFLVNASKWSVTVIPLLISIPVIPIKALSTFIFSKVWSAIGPTSE